MVQKFLVHEIFNSISGEGRTAGMPMSFIRLYGCNLKCKWCDTPQDKITPREMSYVEIEDRLSHPKILITGGEPLSHENLFDFINFLNFRSREIWVETNGAIKLPLRPVVLNPYGRYTHFCMDVKLPSSGQAYPLYEGIMDHNMRQLRAERDELKFVVACLLDLSQIKEFLNFWQFKLGSVVEKVPITVQPVWDPTFQMDKQLVKHIIDTVDDLSKVGYNIRIGIQMHKVLGVK